MSDSSAPSSPPPEPPPAPSAAPPIEASALPESTGLAPNIAAFLASFFSIVGGIVFLVLEKKDQFVRFYAMQSVILGGTAIAVSIALQILTVIVHLIPFVGSVLGALFGLVGMVVGLAFLAAWLVSAFKAFSGKEWEIPYLGKIARTQLAKSTPTVP
jgi:uncharacterized membrane protein